MNTTILKFRAAARPSSVVRNKTNLVTLFALDRPPVYRPRLVAHWHPQHDGRLVCSWEPDLTSKPRP